MSAATSYRTVGRRQAPRRRSSASVALRRSPLAPTVLLQGMLAGLALAWLATVFGWHITAASVLPIDRAGAHLADVAGTPGALGLARVLSYLGHALVVGPLAGALALVARWRWGDWSAGLLLFTVLAGSTGVTGLAKVMTARARPDAAVVETLSSAFPSGHAVRAVAVYGLLAWLLWRLTDRLVLRSLTVTGGVALVLLNGLARVALGVHWPTDVLAGFAVGALWLGCSLALLGPHWRLAAPAPEPGATGRAGPPSLGPVVPHEDSNARRHGGPRERELVAG